jgi:hypothetical protein
MKKVKKELNHNQRQLMTMIRAHNRLTIACARSVEIGGPICIAIKDYSELWYCDHCGITTALNRLAYQHKINDLIEVMCPVGEVTDND